VSGAQEGLKGCPKQTYITYIICQLSNPRYLIIWVHCTSLCTTCFYPPWNVGCKWKVVDAVSALLLDGPKNKFPFPPHQFTQSPKTLSHWQGLDSETYCPPALFLISINIHLYKIINCVCSPSTYTKIMCTWPSLQNIQKNRSKSSKKETSSYSNTATCSELTVSDGHKALSLVTSSFSHEVVVLWSVKVLSPKNVSREPSQKPRVNTRSEPYHTASLILHYSRISLGSVHASCSDLWMPLDVERKLFSPSPRQSWQNGFAVSSYTVVALLPGSNRFHAYAYLPAASLLPLF
jgi:hypothetical protein